MKPGASDRGNGSGSGSGSVRRPFSSDFRRFESRVDGVHSPAFGRSQDDLNLTPRSHYVNPIMDVAGNSSTEAVNRHKCDFLTNNGSWSKRNPQRLQYMHSTDELDALRPRKTRLADPSFDRGDNQTDQDCSSAQGFLAVSPRPNGNGGPQWGCYTTGVCAGPDEVPPTAPRRLEFRPHTPYRPERLGAKNVRNDEDGDDGGQRGGRLMNLDPCAMNTYVRRPRAGLPAVRVRLLRRHVAHRVPRADGRRVRWQPSLEPSALQGRHPAGHLGADGLQRMLQDISPAKSAVLQGDSPSSSMSTSSTGCRGRRNLRGRGAWADNPGHEQDETDEKEWRMSRCFCL